MIPDTLSSALAARGYDTLTPVQEAVTTPRSGSRPAGLGPDRVGQDGGLRPRHRADHHGRGGTLPPAAAPLALIVAPTRELALQVMRELSWLYAGAGARLVSCVGGMDARDERRALERGAHIVVGTPGRLCDHIKRGALDMTACAPWCSTRPTRCSISGFARIWNSCWPPPRGRRTLMFSATVPPRSPSSPRHSSATRAGDHADRRQPARRHRLSGARVAPHDAEGAVINLLRYPRCARTPSSSANTRAMVARLTARLSNRGFAVVSLSGELSQSERTHALQAMRDGRARVCVATDVAARGIDLPNLDLVVHADCPPMPTGCCTARAAPGAPGARGSRR